MKVFGKTLGLLLASLALASCGGSGSNGGAFSPASSTITLSATTTTLPVNTAGYTPAQYGNPTQATVTITWRNPNGSLVSGQTVTASISPPNVAALSCLAPTGSGSGTTTSACVLGQLYGSIPIDSINGQATVFVNALTTAGPATLVVSGVDPTTSQTVSASLTFNVTSGVGPAPASVTLVANPTGVYLPGSGGTNTSSISATVLDGAGQFVPDPVSGNSSVDNIQFQIVGNAGNATLTSSSGSGTTVTSHTVHGVAVVSFQAGDQTPQGPVQIRATVDRADNNVSNGIQDPVSFTISVIVSDGKLYSLEITSPLGAPNLPGITINCVVNTTANPCTPVSSSVTPSSAAIPPDPDATLSLVVTAKAQDRQGNPVLPGTPIRFGSVDEPVGAPGSAQDNQFLLSGLDGNPQEGGTLFTAPTGHFTTAGGGAGPGDALIVFGKAVQGNADLESAVTVQSVTSATSLVVSPAFNLNDTTGVSVDYGAVLPYLIGRSEHGSITAAATTDANLPTGTPPAGIAHAILTYTINSVGDAVAIWAQGDGVDRVTNGVDRVTDAATLDYPGVAPLSIFASPNPIFGNATQTVTVCVTDALGIKLRGLTLGFKFTLTGGTGSIAGSPPGSGALGQPTGLNGCVNAVVTTSGVPISAAGGNSGTLTFNAGSATATVDIVVQLASLQASQTCVAVNKDPQTSTITIAALSTGGTTIPGVAISAACTASGGNAAALTATPANATTGANGSATFSITATGFPGASPPGTGQCVFTSAGGTSQSVTVTFGGVNAGGSGFSPPGGCG